MNELVETPLGSGTDESLDDNLTPFDHSRVCNNAVFPNNVTVSKRPGLATVYSANVTPTLLRLGARGNEVLAFDNANLYTYSPREPNALITRGAVPPFIASRRLLGSGNVPVGGTTVSTAPIPYAPMGAVGEDSSTHLRIEVWEDGQSVQAVTFDAVEKRVVRLDTLSDNAGNQTIDQTNTPHVCIVNSVAFALWWDANTAAIRYSALDLTNVANGWTAAANLLGPGTTNTCWDAAPVIGTAFIALIQGATSPSDRVILNRLTASGTTLTVSGGVAVEISSASYTCAAVYGGPDGIVVSYGSLSSSGGTDTYALRWAAYDSSLSVLQAATNITTNTDVPASPTDNALTFLSVGITRYTGQGSGSTAQYALAWCRHYRSVPSSILSGTPSRILPAFYSGIETRSPSVADVIHGPILGYKQLSKPIAISIAGVVRVFCLSQFYDAQANSAIATTPNSTLVLLEAGQFSSNDAWLVNPPCAVCAPLFAGNPVLANAMDMALSSTTTGICALGFEQESSTNINATSLLFDASSPALYQSTTLGSWTWIAAGCPMIYDGQNVVEVGFVNPPLRPQVQATTGSGSITTNQTMQYCVVYSWQDDDGNIHRSTPSPFSTAIDCTTGCSAITVTVYPCRMTYRQSAGLTANDPGANPIRIEVYRNTAATSDIWQLSCVVENDMTITTAITFSDTNHDATLSTRPFLYTTGGVVPASPTPSLSALTVHANRMWGVSEDGAQSFFTTELVRGECPRFSDSFTLDWPEGPIQAQWSLETRLHAATDSRIFSIYGSGPSDTLAGSDFTPVQPWQDDIGVVDPRCIASFNGGVVFNSKRGLYLEGRDGTYTWIGNQVQRTQDAFPIVTSISPLTSDGAMRITCKATDATNAAGLTIHWDHRRQRWSTHYVQSTAFRNLGAEGGVEVNGVYYVLCASNSAEGLLQESATSNLDDGNWVQLRVTTGWAHPNANGGQNLQGWIRLDRLLLEAAQTSTHSLNIQLARDYSANFDVPAATWSDTDLGGLANEQVSYQPAVQACEAFSVTIYDDVPNGGYGVGAGPILKMLTAAYRPMGGQYRNIATSLRR